MTSPVIFLCVPCLLFFYVQFFCLVMRLEVVWAEDFFHVVSHNIVPFQESGPGIIYLYQWYVARDSIIWLWCFWSYLCVIWADLGLCLGWFNFCAPWGHCDFRFSFHPLMWCRFRMLWCGGLLCSPPFMWLLRCLFHPMKLRRGGGACGTDMLNMDDN